MRYQKPQVLGGKFDGVLPRVEGLEPHHPMPAPEPEPRRQAPQVPQQPPPAIPVPRIAPHHPYSPDSNAPPPPSIPTPKLAPHHPYFPQSDFLNPGAGFSSDDVISSILRQLGV